MPRALIYIIGFVGEKLKKPLGKVSSECPDIGSYFFLRYPGVGARM
jgi:hypothetical protein